MKKLKLITCFLVLSIFSCEKNGTNQEKERVHLNELKTEIISISQNSSCENTTEWNYTAIGNKACGGPTEYIAYGKDIEVTEFLKLVEQYTEAEKNYNQKWEIMSDCSAPIEPKSVSCINGKPTLQY